MKEIVVISGKGGTGKTSIVAAIATLAENKIMTDCDVDASDLHLILSPKYRKTESFTSGLIAEIDKTRCVRCGGCREICRFDAISAVFKIDQFSCEGCGICADFCPENAISLSEKNAGEWFISETDKGTMVHAALAIAEGNSGKLVSLVRKEAKKLATEKNLDLIITDGSPGVGCPVIASITGANMVLIVIEPSVSGIHDMKRILELTKHFRIKSMVCVNKYDLNNDNTNEIEKFCRENEISVVAKIPYDMDFVKAQIEKKNILEFSDGITSAEIKNMWSNIMNELL